MNVLKVFLTTVILLPLALIGGSANASDAGGCPAFNASMVDAAMLAADLSQIDPLVGAAQDSPKDGTIICYWETNVSDGLKGWFYVQVEDGVAQVIGNEPYATSEVATARTAVFDLSPAQQHACRAQVLKSFVWQQYCKPLLP